MTEVVDAFAAWARSRPDVLAVAVVGSVARGTAATDSDVDILVVSESPESYEDGGWVDGAPCRERAYVRRWGPLTEHRLIVDGSPEVDFGVVPREWATERPVDPGTRRVVADGMVPLHDPHGILEDLMAEVAGPVI